MNYPGYNSSAPSYGFNFDQPQSGPMPHQTALPYPVQPFNPVPYPAASTGGQHQQFPGAAVTLPYPAPNNNNLPQPQPPPYPVIGNPLYAPQQPYASSGYAMDHHPNPMMPYATNPGYPTPQVFPHNNPAPASAPAPPYHSYQPGAPPFEATPGPFNQNYPTPTGGQPSSLPAAPNHHHQQGLYPTAALVSNPDHGYQQPSPSAGYAQTGRPEQQAIPTIYPASPFDPRRDAETLRNAMKGFGSDKQALINVLCHRTSSQRAQIAQTFKSLYGKDLRSRLKSELSFNLLRVMVGLTWTQDEFFANELYEAMKGLGTKENVLVEVLCSATNAEIAAVTSAYRHMHNRSLEDDIKGDTSGDFRRIMIALVQGQRDEYQSTNYDLAKQDAQRLYAAGEGRMGTDESTFINIFATRKWAQLNLIASEYQQMRGRSLESAVNGEFSGWIRTSLLAILQCASNRHSYLAGRLKESMVGAGTRDRDLIRLVVSRCDTDLGSIKREYQKMFGVDLSTAISSETSGDYKKALLTLVAG